MTEREELIRFGCCTPEEADRMIAARDERRKQKKESEQATTNQTTEQPC